MEATFWGVRGTIPAPGPETNRYGGNTPCVAVQTRAGHLLILDAGTGIVPLGRHLVTREFGLGRGRAAILLSHAHWAHIQGFPFFAPVLVPGNRFDVYGPSRSASLLEGVLEGQVNPAFSPLYTLKNMGAALKMHPVADGGSFDIDGLAVTARLNPHGSSQVLAYRIEEAGRSLVYASDAGYGPDGPSDAVLALYRGADVLIHDTTFSPEDHATRADRGSSSIAQAAHAAHKAGVGHLVMFHYDQDYDDERVDALKIECRRLLDEAGGKNIRLTAAAEGVTLEV